MGMDGLQLAAAVAVDGAGRAPGGFDGVGSDDLAAGHVRRAPDRQRFGLQRYLGVDRHELGAAASSDESARPRFRRPVTVTVGGLTSATRHAVRFTYIR